MFSFLFLIGGIVMYRKAELKISSKRKITGVKAKNMGALFIAASLLGIFSTYGHSAIMGWISLVLYGVAVLVSIYFVFFTKGDIIESKKEIK